MFWQFGVQVFFVDDKTFEALRDPGLSDHGMRVIFSRLVSENQKRDVNVLPVFLSAN